MPHTRTFGRVVLIAALLASVAAVPASAHTTPAAVVSAPSRGGSPESAVDRVAHFYGAYVDIVHDAEGDSLADALRDRYLTSGLRNRLANWEREHPHADGVLRARGVPTTWEVTPDSSGAGHTWTTVRLAWGPEHARRYSCLEIQSDLSTRRISDIR
ncbi:hypothetical protein [Streptomyces sp. 8N706]|uniref:hypothetical protein n=1 Tax=Streptomyces sp. 8N706 TaxID=3457416 RepID=UPI003FD61CDD